MTKRFFSLFFLATLLISCTAEAQKVHVEGVADSKSSMAYLIDLSSSEQDIIDSVAVNGGKFSADIPTKENCIVGVITNGGYQQIIFAEGEKVKVDVVNDIIEGSGLNEKWGKFQEEKKSLQGNSTAITELYTRLCKENKDNLLPAVALMMAMDDLDMSTLMQLLPDDAPYTKHPMLRQLNEMKKSFALRMPGSSLKDIAIPDAQGNMVKISDYVGKGKYVLVDFWASWCGPCCREMPNVVEAYAKYKSKGLEIVGVSLDKQKDAWLNKVQQLGMTWPQLSDLKGWQCEAAALYGVRSIPSNVLFSPDGTIVTTDLTGSALHNKLAELLK